MFSNIDKLLEVREGKYSTATRHLQTINRILGRGRERKIKKIKIKIKKIEIVLVPGID